MVIFHSHAKLPEGMLGQMHLIPGFRPNPMGFRLLRPKRSATCNSCRKPPAVQAPGERFFLGHFRWGTSSDIWHWHRKHHLWIGRSSLIIAFSSMIFLLKKRFFIAMLNYQRVNHGGIWGSKFWDNSKIVALPVGISCETWAREARWCLPGQHSLSFIAWKMILYGQ